MGLPLHELIYELGGGMLHDDRPLKACIPGGSSVPVLRAEDCDVNLDFDSLAKAGSMLGSAGVMVMDSSTCMVKTMERTQYLARTASALSAREKSVCPALLLHHDPKELEAPGQRRSSPVGEIYLCRLFETCRSRFEFDCQGSSTRLSQILK